MSKFTRSDIREILRSGTGLDVRKAGELTDLIVGALAAALAAGDAVEFRGFGSFEVRERKAYKARNPQTGETLTVPPRRRIIFRPGRELKTALKVSK